ncbi:GlsB/YeaQ/YmgE family stress response membrane protein [Paracoccus aestuarii]|uniref:GlsB/YeaQ/YmgE family stress response membrane protein n=1 Tax=Paracoccus aestuarii TaxID=453842 RepID=A0A418ZT64_9RHOB|nr:GlsB/YeaQ/YmgE family stress response membrane protein [Paracoccus aestuarii]RJL00970.1 GlsB/YeaQ/YmgE family stress response membrane protein [Paracoccus aestuarii]WCQ98924.1 GlsB/YeaQ/YmgE family stress response membrane protein [Paracoccus aestuarii]
MEGYGIILSIILGAIAGWIAEQIMKSNHGLLTNIILGILGAVVGNALFRMVLGATAGGLIGQLIVATIGACILIFLFRAITGRRNRM